MVPLKLFGFCSGRSTIDAPAEVTKQIRQGSTDTFTCILVDLPKTIDSVIREIFKVNCKNIMSEGFVSIVA